MLATTCALSPRDTTRLVFLPFNQFTLVLTSYLSGLIVLTIGNLSKPVTPNNSLM